MSLPVQSRPISSDIAAAQTRLLQIRARLQKERSSGAVPANNICVTMPASTAHSVEAGETAVSYYYAQQMLDRARRRDHIILDPSCSLGTDTVDAAQAWVKRAQKTTGDQTDSDQGTAVSHHTAVRIFPSFATAILDHEQRINGHIVDVAARLFLVLKTIDAAEHNGRGWLSWSEVVRLITDTKSPCYLYGKRQLKNALNRGEGVFWHRVKHRHETRIRLVSRERAAAALGIDCLRGSETAVPLHAILGLTDVRTGKTAVDGRSRMANFRAAMYAAVQGGRHHEEREKPISRQKIEQIYHVSEYRQRSYAKRTGIKTQRNITPICRYSKEKLTAVRQVDGIPAYKHYDKRGILGPRGAAYIARMLPNTYTPPSFVSQQKRNRTCKANKALAGLRIMSGADSGSDQRRVFHHQAGTAIKAADKNADRDAYAKLTTRTAAGVWKNYQHWQEWQR